MKTIILLIIAACLPVMAEDGKVAMVKSSELENALQIKMEKDPGLSALIKKMEQLSDEVNKLEEDKESKEAVEQTRIENKVNSMRQAIGGISTKIEREKEVVLLRTINEVAGKKYLMVINADMESTVMMKRVEIVDITIDVKTKLMGIVDTF